MTSGWPWRATNSIKSKSCSWISCPECIGAHYSELNDENPLVKIWGLPVSFASNLPHLMPRSHQTFCSVPTVQLLGIMLRINVVHHISHSYNRRCPRWCQTWPVWLAIWYVDMIRTSGREETKPRSTWSDDGSAPPAIFAKQKLHVSQYSLEVIGSLDSLQAGKSQLFFNSYFTGKSSFSRISTSLSEKKSEGQLGKLGHSLWCWLFCLLSHGKKKKNEAIDIMSTIWLYSSVKPQRKMQTMVHPTRIGPIQKDYPR